MSAAPLLSARGLTRIFGGRPASLLGPAEPEVRALDCVDIDIQPGKTLGIVGESGSGKTTLSRLLLLLDTPTSGDVLFRGAKLDRRDGTQRRIFRRAVQPVFQNPYAALNPRLKVGMIVTEPLAAGGGPRGRDLRAVAGEALAKVGLAATDVDRFPGEFSGGQRQRIAIARAIAARPELIILDEPVSSQDISVRAQLLNLLKDLQEETKVAFLLITHDLSTLRFMCDDVAVMHRGRIVEQGHVADVCDKPKDAYTRSLLASALSLDP